MKQSFFKHLALVLSLYMMLSPIGVSERSVSDVLEYGIEENSSVSEGQQFTEEFIAATQMEETPEELDDIDLPSGDELDDSVVYDTPQGEEDDVEIIVDSDAVPEAPMTDSNTTSEEQDNDTGNANDNQDITPDVVPEEGTLPDGNNDTIITPDMDNDTKTKPDNEDEMEPGAQSSPEPESEAGSESDLKKEDETTTEIGTPSDAEKNNERLNDEQKDEESDLKLDSIENNTIRDVIIEKTGIEESSKENIEKMVDKKDTNINHDDESVEVVHPVRVTFMPTPKNAIVTVYARIKQADIESEEEKQDTDEDPNDAMIESEEADQSENEQYSDDVEQIPSEEDGSWSLLPGEYYYNASAEGFISVECVSFVVDDKEMTINIVLEAKEESLYLDEENEFVQSTFSMEAMEAQSYNKYLIQGNWVAANSVNSPGWGQCWEYVNRIYDKIWGFRFDESTFLGNENTGLNMLRELSQSDRTLTPEHLKLFITQAELGSVIRITACYPGCYKDGTYWWNTDNTAHGCAGHNLILAAKSDSGLTTFDDWEGLCREKTWTWESFCEELKKYPNIKYIKWPYAPVFSPRPTDNSDPDFFRVDYVETLYTEYGVYRGKAICSPDGYDSHAVCDKPYAKGKEGTTSYSVVNHLPIYGKWSYTTENMNIYGAVKNLYGNVWYKVKDDNGNDGFISSNDVEYVGPWPFIQNYVTTGGWSLADGTQVNHGPYTLTGWINAPAPIQYVQATVTAVGSSSPTLSATVYPNGNDKFVMQKNYGQGALDNLLKFANLSPGTSYDFHVKVFCSFNNQASSSDVRDIFTYKARFAVRNSNGADTSIPPRQETETGSHTVYKIKKETSLWDRIVSGGVGLITKILAGKTVTVTETASVNNTIYGKATYVDDSGETQTGWIALDEKVQDTSATGNSPTSLDCITTYEVITSQGLNVRNGAGLNYGIKTTIWPGTTVAVTQTQAANGVTWGYGTTSNGFVGWISLSSSLVRKVNGSSTGSQTPTDKIPPKFTDNARIYDIDVTGYTISIPVSDNVGVTRVSFPTWMEGDNYSSAIWYDGILSGNTATARINANDFPGHNGAFYTYIYAYDAAGNEAHIDPINDSYEDGLWFIRVAYIHPLTIPKSVSVSKITLDKSEIDMFNGDSETIGASVLPYNATNKKVKWSSNNTSVAIVSDGIVTAINEGVATITCTAVDGSGTEAKCTVSVTPKGIPIDQDHFSDAVFRQHIKDNIDKDNNGFLSSAEIAATTSLSLGYKNITSLEGIVFFSALESLSCYNNQLISLNVSGCTALTYLNCSGNQLTNLNVSGCTMLSKLYCGNNKLTNLNLSGCTALTWLECWNNQLTNLNVSGYTTLTYLSCSDNQLKNLDVTGYTALTNLSCYNNQLTSLIVSGCTTLSELSCGNNKLTSLNVSNCTALSALNCGNNKLSSLNVSACTLLRDLGCSNNQLTNLDVSSCTVLRNLECQNNLLADLNVSNCMVLGTIDCYNNQLTNLNVSNCTRLGYLYCYNNQIRSLDVSNNTRLYMLNCFANQLESLNLDNLTGLYYVNCSYNNLITLSIRNLPILHTLCCSNNQLTALSVDNSSNILIWVDCRHNCLTSLNVNNSRMNQLLCNDNALTSLNIEGCPRIADKVDPLLYRLSEDKKIASYEEYVDRREDDSDTCHTYLACDSSVNIIGGNPVASVAASTTDTDHNPSSGSGTETSTNLDPEQGTGDKPDIGTGTETTTTTDTATVQDQTSVKEPGIETIYAPKNVKATVSVGTGYQIDLNGKTGKKFRSSNKKVATVDQDGLITVKKAGKAKITFKVGKKKRTVSLKVIDPTIPKKITLNMSGTVDAVVDDEVTLTVTLPEGTKSDIKWKSSNKRVATVDDGDVTFKKKGKVTITATAKRGGKKAKVKFKVTE